MTPEQEKGTLATGYVREKLTQLLRDLDNYSAGELWRQMARIAEGGTGIPHAESLARELSEQEERHTASLASIKAKADDLRTLTNMGLGAANSERMRAEQKLSLLMRPPTDDMVMAGQRYVHSYDVKLIFTAMRDQALSVLEKNNDPDPSHLL